MKQKLYFEDSVTAWEVLRRLGGQNGLLITDYGINEGVIARYWLEVEEVKREEDK